MRLISWNINGGFPLAGLEPVTYTPEEKLDYFITLLLEQSPDIVCLQEVHINEVRSQAEEIARALGLAQQFVTIASPSHVDPSYQLANAVLSRYPFELKAEICHPKPRFELNLPLLPDGTYPKVHDKVTQVFKFETFTLANTHLIPLEFFGASYESPKGKAFARELELLWLEHLSEPLLFCGDFNLSAVLRTFPELISRFELQDVLPQESSSIFNPERIDFILASSQFHVAKAELMHVNCDHALCLLDILS
ncbi:MAG: endonuclease/exonuclease/phosphatase family protein [Trueperaceae bacterium]|nr:endonuclease/exonuclease/phosphatase family protein [Trueperaceae bacterium]